MFRIEKLCAASTLFEAGDVSDELDHGTFLRRLSVIAASYYKPGQLKKMPRSQAGILNDSGRVNEFAELHVFGHWLLDQKAPGLQKRDGKQPDPNVLLKTLAVAIAELGYSKRAREMNVPSRKGLSISTLTPTKLAQRWTRVFSEPATAGDMSSRMKSLKRYLKDYLAHIATGAFLFNATKVTASEKTAQVLKELTRTKSAKAAPSAAAKAKTKTGAHAAKAAAVLQTPVDAYDRDPFEVSLYYSSPEHEEQYRDRKPGTLPAPALMYRPVSYEKTSKAGSALASRTNHLVLVPEIDIKASFRFVAVLDRIVLLVSTAAPTGGQHINKLLSENTGLVSHVQDRTIKPKKPDPTYDKLPKLDANAPAGRHFAITIQEPTPELLRTAIEAVKQKWGIAGKVAPWLVELAIDIFPGKGSASTPDERLQLRERMIGFLQRHHWCDSARLPSKSVPIPRHIDARQVYGVQGQAAEKTKYFFHDKAGAFESDLNLVEPKVRQRILKASGDDDLMLNAQIYRGARSGEITIRLQHKITDKRNRAAGTVTTLAEKDRRARVEVEISGTDTLATIGLSTVQDFSSIKLRKLRKDMIVFRLPLVEAFKEELRAAKTQMSYRGIYGWELWKKAQLEELKSAGVKGGAVRKASSGRKSLSLTDWTEMNTGVGRALDNLERRWAKFRWNL